jgi:hypothetical protein
MHTHIRTQIEREIKTEIQTKKAEDMKGIVVREINGKHR